MRFSICCSACSINTFRSSISTALYLATLISFFCGNCYNREYDGYVFVDVMGNIFNPRNLSSNFSKLLELKGLRHIRFHDLRHSCASLLLANDVPMKQIQEWLGHSDISTTANIYSHLDYKSKLMSANVMDNVLTLPETEAVGWQT